MVYGRLRTKSTSTNSKMELVLKPWNHSRTCRPFTKHETTAQSTRKLLAQRSLQSFEQKNTNEHIVHGAEGFLGACLWVFLPSLVGFGAPLPHAQHVWEFNFFGEILAHQKISSSPTQQKTPPNPRSIACIRPKSALASSLSFFFRDRRIDGCFLLAKFWCWKRAMCCSRHIHSTQACDQGIVWTTCEKHLRFFAMLLPSFRMFDHLFVDAEPACDALLWELTAWTRNIAFTREDALASLVPSKYLGCVCFFCML